MLETRPKSRPWTVLEEAELRHGWLNGYPASQIARSLDRTKDSIIGKADRMGLPKRENPIKRAKVVSNQPKPEKTLRQKRIARQKVREIQLPKHKGVYARLEPLDRSECQWPMWGDKEPPSHVFCGRPVKEPGSSWCEEHHKRAFTTSRKAVSF